MVFRVVYMTISDRFVPVGQTQTISYQYFLLPVIQWFDLHFVEIG